MRDLQDRLAGLGFKGWEDDEPGVFAHGTEAAVIAFQQYRGLRADGICGRQTWSALVEAGRVLGERPLYIRAPMLRGDDIASLQRRLGALGFDAGRVDGIFGPDTHRALREFQKNVGLNEDGICGPSTVQALERVSAMSDSSSVVSGIRERLALLRGPRTLAGKRVVVGESGGLASLAESVRRRLSREAADAVVLYDPEDSSLASQANASGADAYLGLRLNPNRLGCHTAYFLGHSGFCSEAGRHLADVVHITVSQSLSIPGLGCDGMSLPILRETKMPAVLVEIGTTEIAVERAAELSEALLRSLVEWAASPVPER